ncbi:hypothetical protein SCHPADRAFT_898344 [Schizopora paradoxa]|uniref:Eukaryotic peptide chain release factor GTP-binding subunit n=1 Tax=Schizopora paradoxa TaxID=27342 RepID=A0A0H2S656_9AGAM|nr:hypothetical protein SCHPADRAFT_898344 [Schizopora paradoxa]
MSGLNYKAAEFVPGQFKYTPPAAAARPPPPPEPVARPELAEAPPPPPTITLNIGGSKPAQPTPSNNINAAPTPASSQPSAPSKPAPSPAPAAQAAPKPKSTAASGTSTPTTQNKTYTMERAKTDADGVLHDAKAAADQDTLKDLFGDMKQHLNIVFIGHVDAGKSTMGGNILFLTGMVDKRTMEKYEKEAKDAGRESWYISWALDSTPLERLKGKTVEVGRGYFETDARRYTILDAPGHKTYVPSMITGAAQADVAILVLSARRGEFETGFEKGGQTREHIILVKNAGVSKLVVVVNKMDEPTVNWDKARYDEIVNKLSPFMKQFYGKNDVSWVPVSAQTGQNLKDRVSKSIAPWYDGPSLLEHLDTMPMVDRKINGPLMLPVSEKYKDMGTIVVGKIESGRVQRGDSLMMMPNHTEVEVSAIYNEMEEEVPLGICGDNVRIRIKGVDDEDITTGFVLTSLDNPVHAVRKFEAQLAILDSKNIICAGYSSVMHVHTLAEEVYLAELLHYYDKKTGRKSKKPPQFAKKGQKIVAVIEASDAVCVERFAEHPQMGRFTLRDEGKTVAIGKITKLIDGTTDVTDGVAKMAVVAEEA